MFAFASEEKVVYRRGILQLIAYIFAKLDSRIAQQEKRSAETY
jgi:hypothetical protein